MWDGHLEADPMERVSVFISYSHDSGEHRRRVLEQIANRLRYDNIDANLDQYTEHRPPRSWPAWMLGEIKRADYVLLVCTPRYRERFEGDSPKGQGQGAKWEGAIITLQMYSDELTGNEEEKCRFIPVAFCDRNEAPVPAILSGASFFNVADPDRYAALVRLLKGIPTAEKPPLGGRVPGRIPAAPRSKRRAARTGPASPEERFCALLRDELGTIRMLGSPDIPNLPVATLDTFVHLRISTAWRSDDRFNPEAHGMGADSHDDLTPDTVMQRAFEKGRVLLIVGDPGSGKTTLTKYYAMTCLSDDGWRKLGFRDAPLPIYLPLREVTFDADRLPASLAESLSVWARKHGLEVSQAQFDGWLRNRRTLLLLDGLDEVRALEERRSICEWVKRNAEDPHLAKAAFVVTSRWTGYRRLDQVELTCPHLRADVKDFSLDQQKQFLTNWFTAALLREPCPVGEPQGKWQRNQTQKALCHAQEVVSYLDLDCNRSLRDLVAVPLLLQIVAVIWKERGIRPRTRQDLYNHVMGYLLEYRDAERGLEPLFSAEQSLRVLRPAALWMQQELQVDEVEKGRLHEKMQAKIHSLNPHVSARRLFENLRDRAGIIADYSTTAYIFRHKSFREYLAGRELATQSLDGARLQQLAGHLGDDWWEETLRFFLGHANEDQFDGFLKAVFQCFRSEDLDVNRQRLLQIMIEEACEKKIDSLVVCLNEPDDPADGAIRKRCLLDCLKTIDSPGAWEAVRAYAHTEGIGADYARELLAQRPEESPVIEALRARIPSVKERGMVGFRNPFEFNAEYIRIPGGTFKYPVTEKTETVGDLYFAKYPVTNQRYRLFISYLGGEEARLKDMVPLASFSKAALAFAAKEKGFKEYLGADPGQWAVRLKAEYDEEKRFKGDDQPVVGVSWFDANVYCLWLSMLEAAAQGMTVENLGREYRLPREVEWVWAAFGRAPGGGLREYPWPAEKGQPSDKLANYNQNVGATTPVGRYPDGATTEGLMDMAGNVWEWMENRYGHKDYPEARSLRGGSWYVSENYLGCSGRLYVVPDFRLNDVGFRVVCSQS
jgi:formylglycine-generating enzyme required for sulfatase activity/energy-coupling factor transporter ATP-binding protein EcfA2